MISKISAKIEGGKRISVHAKFLVDGKKVHEIKTAFPLETSPEEIEAEVEKAGKLFEQESEQIKEQKKTDEVFDTAKKTVNKLNEKQ